ncbi:type III pantothenate kinase [Campylobacter corcagiensis]|uniref:Type III pantothenate kinase n=1 Tax=Campylobacter corcagiensis TaxID=1448857 RepID=A0A7M1LJE8_9BACT|nr:type III pantothenate kinase [Campylobacter corcagiensis]QKF64160.1 pantothenate kinase, type III [Campylobacter corcagiensis]QOQ87645.1 type III pantothenate kinase [Campylobacter corcagiensis]
MLLLDVGNHSAKIWHDGLISSKSIDELNSFLPKEKAYYISVNSNFKPNSNKFIDISDFFEFDTIYKGLGVDRIAGCYIIKNGIVVDAGSAITVDIMIDFVHQGGFIVPGIAAQLKANEEISKVLKVAINSQVSLEALPQKTVDAVSFGIIAPLVFLIKDMSKNKNIYLTGGDGSFFSKFFDNAIFDKNLVFRGMLKALEERGIKC